MILFVSTPRGGEENHRLLVTGDVFRQQDLKKHIQKLDADIRVEIDEENSTGKFVWKNRYVIYDTGVNQIGHFAHRKGKEFICLEDDRISGLNHDKKRELDKTLEIHFQYIQDLIEGLNRTITGRKQLEGKGIVVELNQLQACESDIEKILSGTRPLDVSNARSENRFSATLARMKPDMRYLGIVVALIAFVLYKDPIFSILRDLLDQNKNRSSNQTTSKTQSEPNAELGQDIINDISKAIRLKDAGEEAVVSKLQEILDDKGINFINQQPTEQDKIKVILNAIYRADKEFGPERQININDKNVLDECLKVLQKLFDRDGNVNQFAFLDNLKEKQGSITNLQINRKQIGIYRDICNSVLKMAQFANQLKEDSKLKKYKVFESVLDPGKKNIGITDVKLNIMLFTTTDVKNFIALDEFLIDHSSCFEAGDIQLPKRNKNDLFTKVTALLNESHYKQVNVYQSQLELEEINDEEKELLESIIAFLNTCAELKKSGQTGSPDSKGPNP